MSLELRTFLLDENEHNSTWMLGPLTTRTGIVVQVTIYRIGFGLVEMVISTNSKHTIYRNLYKNTDPRCFSELITYTAEHYNYRLEIKCVF